MLGIGNLARKVFGSANDRRVKALRPIVARINALDAEYKAKSDEELVAKTRELQARAQGGESLDALLPEAFANCREGARRALGLSAFPAKS